MSDPRRPRILLVDDHPDILVAVARLLKADCDIVGALTSSHAVLDRARRFRPDVVVLDLILGDASGLDVCSAITAAVPGACVVILTALADPEIEQEAFWSCVRRSPSSIAAWRSRIER